MFSVNGNPILQSEKSVIIELRNQAALSGLNIFKDIKESGNDIMVNCPFHKFGQERKPSFGINKTTMQCHCFSCGYSGSLYDVISKIFGYDDNGEYGKKWLSTNFLAVAIEERKPLNLNFTRNKIKKKSNFITEEELDRYRYIHPYMYERGLTDEIIEKFDVGYDSVSNCITFPVCDINKNCVFIARRNVAYKYFNYPTDVQKPVYGAYLFVGGLYKYAVICESIFNALTCWKWGIPAVALLGTGTKNQYKILNDLPVRKYIIATDPDEAGERAADKLRRNLSRSKIIKYYVIPEGKDLNDLDKKVLDLKEIF